MSPMLKRLQAEAAPVIVQDGTFKIYEQAGETRVIACGAKLWNLVWARVQAYFFP